MGPAPRECPLCMPGCATSPWALPPGQLALTHPVLRLLQRPQGGMWQVVKKKLFMPSFCCCLFVCLFVFLSF